MAKIRIAYLIDTISSDKAGTEKQLLSLIARLNKDLFDVTLIALQASPWMSDHRLPCQHATLGYRGFLKTGFPKVLVRYLHLLEERRFQLVQTFFEDAVFVGYLGKLLGKHAPPLLISRRDLGVGADEPRYHSIYRKLIPLVSRSAAGFATNAAAIMADLVDNYGIMAEKVRVIPNGIDLPARPEELPPLFREYRADLWIAIAANLKPVKRVDLLLRAVAMLKARSKTGAIRAVVLGEGSLKAELASLARELGISESVHFLGSVEKVTDYLYGVDVGVICSDLEGLSNSILEYMACGLPVVATATGGNCELVDESNGITFPPGDCHSLADALERLVTSAQLRRALGAKSRQKARAMSWDRVLPQWESYYRSLAR